MIEATVPISLDDCDSGMTQWEAAIWEGGHLVIYEYEITFLVNFFYFSPFSPILAYFITVVTIHVFNILLDPLM